MSAPCSIGRTRYGVASVASTTSGTPAACATCGEPGEVGDLAGGVGDHLGVEQLGLRADRGGVVGGVGARDERRLDAEAAQRDVELRDGAAVQLGGGDDVVPGADERGEGDELRRHARGGGDRADAALEARRCAPRARRPSGCRCGSRCCRTSAARTGSRRPRCPRTRTRWSGRSARHGRRSTASGMPPACSARVRKPKRWSVMGGCLLGGGRPVGSEVRGCGGHAGVPPPWTGAVARTVRSGVAAVLRPSV